MKKIFLLSLTVLFLLFSCATGKELERVETNVEKIEDIVVTEEVDSEVSSIPLIEQKEEEEEDLSTLPVLFKDGDFIDIKNERAEIKSEEKKETPVAMEESGVTNEDVNSVENKKELNVIACSLLALFIVLALVVFILIWGTRKKRNEKKEEPLLWEEKEEYSSLLKILSEEKNEENK